MNIDIQVERWPIERLIPRVNNPRTHSREQVARIAESIQEFRLGKSGLVRYRHGTLSLYAALEPMLLGTPGDSGSTGSRRSRGWKGPLRLAISTCRRMLDPAGAMTEIVELDGRDEDIDEGEREKFIESFPIYARQPRSR